MTELETIASMLSARDLDLRKSNNGRWIDQKCTPDVVCMVSDAIMHVSETKPTFSVKDVWGDDYSKNMVEEQFAKPDTDSEKASSEYDKFFQQPMKMLEYAGVLVARSKSGRSALYEVAEPNVLSYVSLRPVNARRFICMYVDKVLSDSGLTDEFERFLNEQTPEAFDRLKRFFSEFYGTHTPIKGSFEPNRIFSKVLNPIACREGKKGTVRGRLSNVPITPADLNYGRSNFRDEIDGKPKNVTRKEWVNMKSPPSAVEELQRLGSVAKKRVRQFNDRFRNGKSELTEFLPTKYDDDLPAIHSHHIVPINESPELQHYPENISQITPNQHYSLAHPNGKTTSIDVDVQVDLLLAKTSYVERNASSDSEERLYDKKRLLEVISTAFHDDSFLGMYDSSYDDIRSEIESRRASLVGRKTDFDDEAVVRDSE